MNDMSPVIVPKSDQISADSLIAGPITIKITEVDIRPGTEQPVSIFFEGDEGQPWKPCKSMSRVLVSAWGPDAKVYVGRSVSLYRDPKVKWGGMEVGGIRISHLSHIDREMVLALTATKGKRAPYMVKPLKVDSAPRQQGRQESREQGQDSRAAPSDLTLEQRAAAYEKRLREAPSTLKLTAIRNAGQILRGDLDKADPERLVVLEELFNELYAAMEDAEREPSA